LMAGPALSRDVKQLLGYPAVETVCSEVTNGAAANHTNAYQRGNGK
jgi:hypothetical protein